MKQELGGVSMKFEHHAVAVKGRRDLELLIYAATAPKNRATARHFGLESDANRTNLDRKVTQLWHRNLALLREDIVA